MATLGALEASLRRRFRVVETEFEVGRARIALLHPASAEELISEEDFARDERLPYWAEPWPSARVLAARVLEGRGDGRPLLELGSGAGLVTAAAALAGYDVTASDYYEDAVAFARVNAWRVARRRIAGLHLDWRALPEALPRWETVLASDVLYERPYASLVAATIARTLAPGGRALVADPGRAAAGEFVAALPALGLAVEREARVPFVEGEIRQTIDLWSVQWAAAAAAAP